MARDEQDRGEHKYEDRDRHRQPQHGDQCGQCGDRGGEHAGKDWLVAWPQGVSVSLV